MYTDYLRHDGYVDKGKYFGNNDTCWPLLSNQSFYRQIAGCRMTEANILAIIILVGCCLATNALSVEISQLLLGFIGKLLAAGWV